MVERYKILKTIIKCDVKFVVWLKKEMYYLGYKKGKFYLQGYDERNRFFWIERWMKIPETLKLLKKIECE